MLLGYWENSMFFKRPFKPPINRFLNTSFT